MPARKTILIVDDDRRMARTLSDILTVKGYEALTAYSGEEGLEKIAHLWVHAALCDVRLPDMDGALFAELARRTRPALPIILLTAYTPEEILPKERLGVFTAVLRKPLDINLLLGFYASLGKESHFSIVDDDPRMYRSLADILRLRGYAVEEVKDTARLPELPITGTKAFLLQLKVNSPSGGEVLRRLHETYRHTPIVLVTAYREEVKQTLEQSLQYNVYTCLYRPHEIEGLIESLQGLWE